MPFWRGGIPALNMAAGDVMLDEDGNAILDDDGDVLLDDGAGCTSCCEDVCPECQVTTAAVTLTSVSRCYECSNNGQVDVSPASFTTSFTLSFVGSSPCRYQFSSTSGGPVTLRTREGVPGFTCTGDICSTIDGVLATLTWNSPTWALGVILQDTGWSGGSLFEAEFSPPDVSNPFCFSVSGIENENECGPFISLDCLSSSSTDILYIDGTATVTIIGT